MTAAQKQYAPSVTLAQQALNLYDQRGEFAMMTFMMNNIRTSEDGPYHWQQNGYCALDDGSDILHQNGKYTFGWYNQETGKQTTHQRFSAMPNNGRPEPINSGGTPVIAWPDRNEVWSWVIQIIEVRSNKETDNYVITETDVSYRISPSLYHAISKGNLRGEDQRIRSQVCTKHMHRHRRSRHCNGTARRTTGTHRPHHQLGDSATPHSGMFSQSRTRLLIRPAAIDALPPSTRTQVTGHRPRRTPPHQGTIRY